MNDWCGGAYIGHYERTILFKYECSSCDLYEYDLCAKETPMTTITIDTINRMIDAGISEGSLKINEEPQLHWKYCGHQPIEDEPDWLLRRIRRNNVGGGLAFEKQCIEENSE
jgi:hypothetical protein